MSENKCCGNCQEDFSLENIEESFTEYYTVKEIENDLIIRVEPNNGWTEITPDNVDEVYNIPVNRMIIGRVQGGVTVGEMYQNMSPTLNTMAKVGGYYYFVLPELEIKEEEKE